MLIFHRTGFSLSLSLCLSLYWLFLLTCSALFRTKHSSFFVSLAQNCEPLFTFGFQMSCHLLILTAPHISLPRRRKFSGKNFLSNNYLKQQQNIEHLGRQSICAFKLLVNINLFPKKISWKSTSPILFHIASKTKPLSLRRLTSMNGCFYCSEHKRTALILTRRSKSHLG